MTRTAVRETEPWRDTRLTCGIGHVYRGRVRMVEREGHDMDGEAFWYPPEHDYDPSTCVVCGLITWSEAE